MGTTTCCCVKSAVVVSVSHFKAVCVATYPIFMSVPKSPASIKAHRILVALVGALGAADTVLLLDLATRRLRRLRPRDGVFRAVVVCDFVVVVEEGCCCCCCCCCMAVVVVEYESSAKAGLAP